MKGTPTTTSVLAGMGPAPLNSPMSFSSEAMVPLDFQLPPMRYLRVFSGAGLPVEEPEGREQAEAKDMVALYISFIAFL